MVGVCSYLLINFWFTRLEANKSAMLAILMNRIGDWGFSIGIYFIFLIFGTLDFASIFAISHVINDENLITFVCILLFIGAMAKSAQLGLNTWLPQAMEGPTPVSALLHAATMVNCSRWILKCILLWYRYMLKQPYIKFIHILSNLTLNKMNKKILCLISNKNLLKFNIKKVNQQEILFSKFSNINDKNKESSETKCDITYNFDEYSNLIPLHKKKINKNFLEWFIGFTEGDGSFIVSKNKVYFDITQNLQDIQVLYYIKKELGFGKIIIRNEKHRNVGIFYVSSKDNFTRLITIFNGNLSTNYKKEQFKIWLDTYNKQYNMNIVFKDKLVKPDLSSGWISGFSDAKSCFTGRVKNCWSSKLKRAPHLTFQISQKEFYIIKILRDLFLNKDSFDLKNIKYDKSWDGWVFHCSSFTKLKVIKNYFFRYELKTKKSIVFKKWCKIYDMVLDKKHLTLEGLNKIDLLTKEINKFIS